MRVGTLLLASARRRLPSLALLAATSAASSAVLSTFAAAASSPSFAGLAGFRVYIRRAFEGSSAVMALLALLAGWYYSEHFLGGRRRELALWLLAGARRRTLLGSLAAELGASIAAGLLGGLAAGALLSRLFALALGLLMRSAEVPSLRFGAVPIAAAAGAAFLQYAAALRRASVELSRCSVAELARAERSPELPARGGRARAIAGALLIGLSYAGAIFSRGLLAEALILPVLIGAVAGTFLVFEALVPALARAFRFRSAGLGAAGIFAAAQIAFRSRRNARLLALAAVLVGMAASAAGTLMTSASRLRVEGSYGQDELVGALLFIGGFLSAVFALSAAALLAARAASDARDDRGRRAALRDLGAPRRCLALAIGVQNAFLFGLPTLFGIAHCAAALSMLETFSGYPSAGATLASGSGAALLLGLAAAASTARELEALRGNELAAWMPPDGIPS